MNEVCSDLVRLHERDRYLSTLFAPDDKQPHLMALYAFHVEVSRVWHTVSEVQIGEIRLQWWSDTLDAIGRGERQDHPVAQRLSAAVASFQLPLDPLRRLIEAHGHDLYADRFASLNDLEGYLGETQSSLFLLGGLILAPEAARPSADLAGLAGVAYGLARVIASVSRPAGLIPEGLSVDDLRTLCTKRQAELRQVSMPKGLLPVYLPCALVETYRRAGPQPVSLLRRQWKLWRAARRGTI